MEQRSVKMEAVEPEGGLLSDLREVQCLICCLIHQMFIADPNIAKLVHFQVTRVMLMHDFQFQTWRGLEERHSL